MPTRHTTTVTMSKRRRVNPRVRMDLEDARLQRAQAGGRSTAPKPLSPCSPNAPTSPRHLRQGRGSRRTDKPWVRRPDVKSTAAGVAALLSPILDLAEQARQDKFFADADAECDAQLEKVEQMPQMQWPDERLSHQSAYDAKRSARAARLIKEVCLILTGGVGNCSCTGRNQVGPESVRCKCSLRDDFRVGCCMHPTELDHSPRAFPPSPHPDSDP